MPCAIRLLKVSRTSAGFLDFDEYERLLDADMNRWKRGLSDSQTFEQLHVACDQSILLGTGPPLDLPLTFHCAGTCLMEF
jgi:hypothetical protein